jgi:ADP-heptose:LPS heptosyltransferase
MNLKLVRWVDYWIGIPLTLLLSIVDFLRARIAPAKRVKPKRVLFVELSEMGSAIIAYSSLVRAINEVGVPNVYFLIFSRNRESVDLLNLLPHDQVLVIDDRSFSRFIVSTMRAIFETWHLSIDAVIDLELFSRFTALFSYATKANIRAGFHRFTNEGLFRGTFINRPVLYNNHKHMAINFLALTEAAFSDSVETPRTKKDVSGDLRDLPRLTIAPREAARSDAWLADLRNRCKKILVINPHPGLLLPLRGWPLENYVTLVRQIVMERADWGIVVVGLSEAAPYAKAMCSLEAKERVLDLTGVTESLLDLLAVLESADLFITNDSGPAHFASLVRAPSIVLFGPETPRLYGPLHPEAVSLVSGVACSPCFSAYNHRATACNDNRCMQEIPVQRVLDTADKILSGLHVLEL